MTIRILLIDDHTLFRSGVRALLQRQSDFEVVDEAADGVEGIKRAKQHRPDVILLDLNMPGLSGLEALQLLTEDLPECAVIVLTVSEEGEELASALRSGARGYLIKNIETDPAGCRRGTGDLRHDDRQARAAIQGSGGRTCPARAWRRDPSDGA